MHGCCMYVENRIYHVAVNKKSFYLNSMFMKIEILNYIVVFKSDFEFPF